MLPRFHWSSPIFYKKCGRFCRDNKINDLVLHFVTLPYLLARCRKRVAWTGWPGRAIPLAYELPFPEALQNTMVSLMEKIIQEELLPQPEKYILDYQ